MDLVATVRDARATGDVRELRVCADWLEQQGDAARGSVIQLEADRMEVEPYDRRAVEVAWELRALVAEHAARWRAELPVLPGIEWTELAFGLPIGVRVANLDVLCELATQIASVGLVDRVELVENEGEIAPKSLGFIETVISSVIYDDDLAQLGTAIEWSGRYDPPAFARKRPLSRFKISGNDQVGNDFADHLANSAWAAKLTDLEIPTGHDGTNTGYYGDPRLRDHGVTSLTKLTALERLVLDGQPVSGAGLAKLCKKLPKLRVLSARGCGGGKIDFGKGDDFLELDLSQNAFKPEAWKSNAIHPRLASLRKLALDTCELTGLALEAIAAAPMWQTLRSLDLSRNPLGTGGARVLTEVAPPPSLHTLAIADCDFDEKAHHALAQVKWLGQLLSLDVSGNQLGKGALLLRALPPDQLRRLMLGAIGMDRADASALARFWPHLYELDLSNNPLGDAALERFAVMREGVRLQTLNLTNCNLTDDGIDLLGNARVPHLSALDLSRNRFGVGLAAFVQTPACAHLQQLSIASCAVPGRVIASLQLPPTLERLDVSGNKLDQEAIVAIARSPGLRGVRTLVVDGEPWNYPEPIRAEVMKRFGWGVPEA
ncbi:MAG: hypothetical protein QM831_06290 [Kofleriaceae bacterium]